VTSLRLDQLRPLSLPELLDRAVRLYRQNFFKFTGVVAVVLLPITALQILASLLSSLPLILSTPDSGQPGLFPMATLGSFGLAAGNGILYFFLIQGVASAWLTRAIADHVLGEPAGIVATFRRLRGDWLQWFIVLILAYVVSVGLTIWWLVPCVGWATGLGMSLIFNVAVLPLLAPVVLLEKQKAVDALRRAWELARQRFWPILGFTFLLGLFQQAVLAGPTLLFLGVYFWMVTSAITTEDMGSFFAGQSVMQSLMIMFGNVFFVPLQMAAINVLYLDLRVRTEGLDLAAQAARLGEQPPAEVLQQAPPRSGPWFRREDWRNLVIVSLLALAAFVVLMIVYFVFVFGLLAASPTFGDSF
jgi:hypothetical protein